MTQTLKQSAALFSSCTEEKTEGCRAQSNLTYSLLTHHEEGPGYQSVWMKNGKAGQEMPLPEETFLASY